jgi:hypothetical protein
MIKEEIPSDIMDMVLGLGKVDVGATSAMSIAEHGAGFTELLQRTCQAHGLEGATQMHSVRLLGIPVPVNLALVGNSPNSPTLARAICGAWNRFVDACADQRAQDEITESRRQEEAA